MFDYTFGILRQSSIKFWTASHNRIIKRSYKFPPHWGTRNIFLERVIIVIIILLSLFCIFKHKFSSFGYFYRIKLENVT